MKSKKTDIINIVIESISINNRLLYKMGIIPNYNATIKCDII